MPRRGLVDRLVRPLAAGEQQLLLAATDFLTEVDVDRVDDPLAGLGRIGEDRDVAERGEVEVVNQRASNDGRNVGGFRLGECDLQNGISAAAGREVDGSDSSVDLLQFGKVIGQQDVGETLLAEHSDATVGPAVSVSLATELGRMSRVFRVFLLRRLVGDLLKAGLEKRLGPSGVPIGTQLALDQDQVGQANLLDALAVAGHLLVLGAEVVLATLDSVVAAAGSKLDAGGAGVGNRLQRSRNHDQNLSKKWNERNKLW